MPDVVVTVPKSFRYNGKKGLAAWIDEGDLPGSEWSGLYSFFWLGTKRPNIEEGDRVYVVCEGKLRGYAPLFEVAQSNGRYALVRKGDAVAVTLEGPIRGFQGFRYRWWEREDEIPFDNWQTP